MFRVWQLRAIDIAHRQCLRKVATEPSPWRNTIQPAADLSSIAPAALSLGVTYRYRSVNVKAPEQLERDLNVLGQDGFHVVPKSLDWRRIWPSIRATSVADLRLPRYPLPRATARRWSGVSLSNCRQRTCSVEIS